MPTKSKKSIKCRICIPEFIKNESIRVTDPSQVHKLTRVLRVKKGDWIEVFNGKGVSSTCEIVGIESHFVSLKQLDAQVGENLRMPRKAEFQPRVHPKKILAIALIKSEPMKWLLQKSVELGVDEIIPIVSERVVAVEKDESRFEKKRERFEQIIVHASEQCGRVELPKLHSLQSFRDLMDRSVEYPHKFILSTHSQNKDYQQYQGKDCLVLIGPEGDFSSQEYQMAQKMGFVDLTLGGRILRAETAVIATLSILNFINL